MQSPIRKILVPVDFSVCSRHALEYALSLAPALGARIDVLNVWNAPVRSSSGEKLGARGQTLEAIAQTECEREMSEFLAKVARPDNVALSTAIKFGDPDVVIVEAAKGYDLVVMGTNGRSGIQLFVVGSVAENVVRRAPCPVLTIRASA